MYSTKEIAKLCNISISKIRYFDKQNVLRPSIKRDKNNYRIFTDEDVIWINDIICFQNASLSIEQIREIKTYYQQNDYKSLEQTFINHEKQVYEKLIQMQKAHQRVLEKINYYQNKQKEK